VNLTFLNALFLAGMAAGIVPIVIHLLNRRRLKRIEFSDLRFLAPLNQQRMRSLNLRRLLLLALRVAIIVFTALAMARPSVRGAFSRLLPTQARSSVLLLVDTSYSMRAEGETGTALDGAKARALQLLAVLEKGDQVNLVTFDAAPHREFQNAIHDLALVRQRIEALQPGHGTTHWSKVIEEGLVMLAAATEPNREMYVISDFAGANLDSVRADLEQQQGDTRIVFVPVGVEPFVNVSLEDVHVPPGAVLLGEPVRVGVTVRNHASDAPADCALQLELGGQPKGEASLRLGGGGQQTYEFTLVATQPDAVAGAARKRVDRLAEDDVRYFVLPVLAQLRVLLVRGAGVPGDAGGSFYVSRALAPTGAARSPLVLTETEAGRFSSRDLEGVQVVVLSSNALLGVSQAQILADFVRDGGGLLLLGGQRQTADGINRLLLERLGGARVRGIVQSSSGYVNLADLRPSGILSGFREPELRTLESIKFTRYSELAAGPETRPLLRFSGGGPALLEGRFGSGKYMVFAFDAALEGSDLAVSPMFLPLLHRSVVYLAGETGRQKLVHMVGERIEVQVPIPALDRQASADAEERLAQAGRSDGGAVPSTTGQSDDRSFTVTTPSGRKEAVVARYVGRTAIVTYENTREPGHYVFEGAGRKLARAVNVDTAESDLRRLDLEELARALNIKVDRRLEHSEDIARSVREARHGKELYKLVVALVLVLLTLELFLSRGGAADVEPSS
jgi:hypothetical protein